MSDIVERLAPCPFCGCTDIVASNVGEDEDNWFVGCMEKDCGVNPGVFCPDSEAAAVAMWNRRSDATITALREEVERLRNDVSVLDQVCGTRAAELTALRQHVAQKAGQIAEALELRMGFLKSAETDSINADDLLEEVHDTVIVGTEMARIARALVNEMETTK